ncbi:hypothetical protein AB0E77_12860 [Streptomyces sp. NPDC032940]|uniref:hypothetical protein n=1 Tax=Streptomyces sp. NPDC032940 TaxID=3155366 RepID=UPI0033D1EBE0
MARTSVHASAATDGHEVAIAHPRDLLVRPALSMAVRTGFGTACRDDGIDAYPPQEDEP